MLHPIALVPAVVRMAAADLVARPLRSLLTVATFAISVVIAIVLVAAGRGLHDGVSRILGDLGEGQITAIPGRTTGVGGVRRSGREVRIRYRDLGGIGDALPSFSGVAAYFDLRGGGASSWKYSIPWSPTRAVAPGYRDVRGLPLVEGRWFTPREEEDGEWVTVLNEGLRRMVFREHAAVGQWIEWRGRRMTVVGVVRDEALFPYIFFIPYQTVGHLADARYITGVIARPREGARWDHAVMELRRALGGLGDFEPADESALEVETNHEFTTQARLLTAALHALVATIAAVSLLLGGLGVANMMAIGVAERTREIGLRRAVGATAGTVFSQVFVEACIVLTAGGALGLGAGAVICELVGELPMTTTYTTRIELDLISSLACLGALGAVAVLSALLPARRAAALVPVEALRWE